MSVDSLKKTPLYEKHKVYGGKLVDFNGWALPIQFKGILEEHATVRKKAGLFDVSHMGEIELRGKRAEETLQRLIVGDITKLQDKQILYTLMCYPDGGIVDDLLVYKCDKEKYLLVVNASNIDKDFQWIKEHLPENSEVEDLSEAYAQIALQGPLAQKVLQKLTQYDLDKLKFFFFEPEVVLAGVPVILSRTGYTGEDGFELYIKKEDAPLVWDDILTSGEAEGVEPIGLGARDTLRFEARLPLYGQELGPEITPLEAGLSYFVDFNKENFIGKEALDKEKAIGSARRLIGFEMLERGIARHGFKVEVEGDEIGYVTTGSFAPSLKKNLGLALINSEYAQIDKEINIIIRDKPLRAKIVKTPFYTKKYKK